MAQKVLPSKLRDLVSASLDELKAVDPVTINVKKLSSFTDYMIIASGTSNRHIPVSYTHLTLPTILLV